MLQSDVKMPEKTFQKPWIFKTVLEGHAFTTPSRIPPLPPDTHTLPIKPLFHDFSLSERFFLK